MTALRGLRRPIRGTLVALLLCLALPPAAPAAEPDADEFLHDFLPGSYRLLGQLPAASHPYSGTLQISRTPQGLQARRRVDGRTTPVAATLERATADAVPVLRMRFTDHGRAYAETCLIHSDLDNYPRLTCTLYLPGQGAGPAGIEALFALH